MRTILLATMFSLGGGAAYADPPAEQPPTIIEPTAPAPNPPPPNTLRCVDGTQSTTAARGACSHHGGVMKRDDREPMDPYASPGTRCLDGWLSPIVGPGACTQHGGVMHGGPIPLPPKVPPRPTPDPITPTSSIGTRCLDGTLAMSGDRTACAKHGGVIHGKPITSARA